MDDFSAAPLQGKIALATLAVALAISVVTDLRSRLIFHIVIVPALLVVAGCFLWLGGWPLLFESALGVLVCAGPFWLSSKLNRKWMGWGDGNLMAVSGAVSGAAAGWPFALSVLLYVAVAGGVQSLLWIIVSKLLGRERPKYVPYGVAIAAGTAWAFLFGAPMF